MQQSSKSITLSVPVTTPAPFAAPQREIVPEPKVKETNSHYLVSMKVPHVNKKDLKIELKHHKQLMVRGCFGNFFQTVTFASPVQSDNVKASLVEGTLQLLLPKAISSHHSFH